MKIATAFLKSISPYSQSRHYDTKRLSKERDDDYERRTWRDRMHVTETGYVFIPALVFKNCLSEVAKYLGEKIPGKGKSTFTKNFEGGLLVLESMILGIKAKDVPGEWLFVPSNGQRGSGKRIAKCFPTIAEWSGEVRFHVLDDVITRDAFERHLEQAGKFIGIGRFRPRNNGYYGRFLVERVEWSEE